MLIKNTKYLFSLTLLLNIAFNNNINSMQIKRKFETEQGQSSQGNKRTHLDTNQGLGILDMPDEILLQFIESTIELSINENYKTIFDCNKNLIKEDIINTFLICKRFASFSPKYSPEVIINIAKRLKNNRALYLKQQIINQYSHLSKELLNEKLLEILNNNNGNYKNYTYKIEDIQEAIKLIIAGADINTRSTYGDDLLLLAVKNNWLFVVKFIIDYFKSNLTLKDLDIDSAFVTAIKENRIAIVNQLVISNVIDINKYIIDDMTPLTLAILECKYVIVRLLLNNGAQISKTDVFTATADTRGPDALKIISLLLSYEPKGQLKAYKWAKEYNYRDALILFNTQDFWWLESNSQDSSTDSSDSEQDDQSATDDDNDNI